MDVRTGAWTACLELFGRRTESQARDRAADTPRRKGRRPWEWEEKTRMVPGVVGVFHWCGPLLNLVVRKRASETVRRTIHLVPGPRSSTGVLPTPREAFSQVNTRFCLNLELDGFVS